MHAHAHAPCLGAQKKKRQAIFWGVACLEGESGCQPVGDTWIPASEVCLKKSSKS